MGGLIGATVIAAGWGALNVQGIVNKVLIPMLTSPLIGFVGAFLLMLALTGSSGTPSASRWPRLPATAGHVGGIYGLRARLE